ncbi:MFS multidrug transporter [Fusarium austroafricanum]|uniref:MFS multidrug transporter n=1 Tax=Fusarium austroafricanum TaxID=2364996 RepID=A0A8H4P0U4_9HYPO|nr:MFS multidrug transporter [Fusarium austroafricanum]
MVSGLFASLAWVMAVCYWQFAPIRWVLFSGVFLVVRGGDAVASSVVHAMVTDVTDRAERAQVFLHLHAADVISGFFGLAISAPLMEKGHSWAVNTASPRQDCGSIAYRLIISTARIFQVYLQEEARAWNNFDLVDSSYQHPDLKPTMSPPSCRLRPPQTSARELFTVIGLQYSKAKYSLSYARGNVLLSLFQGVQGLLVLVLLPLLTRTFAEPRGWTEWGRDRRYAIVSIAVTAGGVVRSNEASTVYSTALTLSMVSRSVTAPVMSTLLVKGMELGWGWVGLPFVLIAMLMAAVTVAKGFISPDKVDHEFVDQE